MQTVGSSALAADGEHRQHSHISFGYGSLQPLAALVEAAVLFAAGIASIAIYNGLIAQEEYPTTTVSWGVVVMATLTYVTLSYLTGGYQPKGPIERRAGVISALRTWGATLSFLALCAFLFKVGANFSRATILIYAVQGAILVSALRVIWPYIVRRAIEQNLVFVTNVLVLHVHRQAPDQTTIEPHRLQELRASGLRPIAWQSISLSSDEDEFSPVAEQIHALLRSGRVREIIILAKRDALDDLDSIVDRLRIFPLPVRFVLDTVTRSLMSRALTKTGSLVLAECQRAPFSYVERSIKRALDISISLVSLVLLSPFFLLIALAIKLDSSGPVLFRQTRRGFGGKTFQILKFRSMTVADNGPVVVQATKNDARITRLGKLIRRTSIDELPQLWNVLRGDMSIVGPRPHAVAHDDYYARFIEEYAFRHHAKPGLTGWAQVKGLRGETPLIENMQARIENDIWYINNWSIWLDISIIMRTFMVVLHQKTAY